MARPPLSVTAKGFLIGISKPPAGQMLFTRLCGSQGYNLATADSDYNVSGVWSAYDPSIDAERHRKMIRSSSVSTSMLFEAGYFCDLLLQGTPVAIEILYGDHLCNPTLIWEELIDKRHRFFTRRVIYYHVWIANRMVMHYQNLYKNDVHISTTTLYRFVRLLFLIDSLIKGEPEIWINDTSTVGYLLNVRSGNESEETILALADVVLTQVRKTNFRHLPEEPDYDFLQDWLLRTRKIM